jgi:hypothetical protein
MAIDGMNPESSLKGLILIIVFSPGIIIVALNDNDLISTSLISNPCDLISGVNATSLHQSFSGLYRMVSPLSPTLGS